MRRGAWHQFGDRSQRLAREQLDSGAGVGVIISPRDLSFSKAQDYVPDYQSLGAEVLVDQQFYLPAANVGKLDTYPIASERQAISQLVTASESTLIEMANALRITNSALNASAVVAPAVVYEAGRSDIEDLNQRLFLISRSVAEELGVPCYATVFLGASTTSADTTINTALSSATALPADGWYFAFEFDGDRIPTSSALVARYLRAGLALALTGLPVLHAYIGPLAPLALACGGTGAAIGHSQNVWQFTRSRWEPTIPGGGGGDAPPRYFSLPIWGTIVYEDEWALLPQALRDQLHTSTPFSTSVNTNSPFLPWDRWTANKHLVFAICQTVQGLSDETDAEIILDEFRALLAHAVSLHEEIADQGIPLRDDTASYQGSWREALLELKVNQAADFEFLRLLA